MRKFLAAGLALAFLSSAVFAASPPPGQLITGWTGTAVKQIKTDSSGKLEVVGSAAGGTVYGPDAAGVAPTQAPIGVAWDGTLTRRLLTDTSGRFVANINTAVTYGTVAAGAAASVSTLMGGVYNSTLPTLTNGQQSAAQFGTRGSQNVTIFGQDATTSASVATPADGATAGAALSGFDFGAIYNGTNWDRSRSIINATNSTGTGIAAVGITAQVDDTSPTAITENQFGNVRMDATRAIYVAPYGAASQKTAVTGTCTATSNSATFAPQAGRGINVTLSGTFVATEVLQRSFDAGATWFPITIGGSPISYTSAVSEQAWNEPEVGVLVRLACTWTSGTVTYRISQ